ncbi:hypothetical protein IMG5_069490, partial [Ichthyophthirius multifiliis]
MPIIYFKNIYFSIQSIFSQFILFIYNNINQKRRKILYKIIQSIKEIYLNQRQNQLFNYQISYKIKIKSYNPHDRIILNKIKQNQLTKKGIIEIHVKIIYLITFKVTLSNLLICLIKETKNQKQSILIIFINKIILQSHIFINIITNIFQQSSKYIFQQNSINNLPQIQFYKSYLNKNKLKQYTIQKKCQKIILIQKKYFSFNKYFIQYFDFIYKQQAKVYNNFQKKMILNQSIKKCFSNIVNNKKVRVRFAPSPTGLLHLGGLRTALFNYLFAKNNNGQFILRIEDTDNKRFVEGSIENIIENLNYFQINYDEGPKLHNIKNYDQHGPFGPYFQSQRLDIYQSYIKNLIQKEDCYHCFCDAKRLEGLKKHQIENKLPQKYDRYCRMLTNQQVFQKIQNKEKYTIRLKIPEGKTIFEDIIYGKIAIDNSILDDQVLIKSDGFPTYHFANVIDDYSMKISHVIRGNEWISSTPKHIILYQALNFQAPIFAHIPLLVKKGGAKLSKREANASVDFYRQNEYLPQAINNFIALLGWNPQDQIQDYEKNKNEEVFQMHELEQL